MFESLTIKSRLTIVMVFLCLLLIGTGLLGLNSLKRVNASLNQEQSAGIDQINRAVMQMDEAVQQNSAMVEEAAAAANALRDEAGHLARVVSAFNLEASAAPSV